MEKFDFFFFFVIKFAPVQTVYAYDLPSSTHSHAYMTILLSLAYLFGVADVSGPTTLQLSPTLIVENSPGLRPGAKVKCERVLIRGLPRIKHLNKFANSVKVKVSCANQSGKRAKIEICFHRCVDT